MLTCATVFSFRYVKLVSPDQLIQQREQGKVSRLNDVRVSFCNDSSVFVGSLQSLQSLDGWMGRWLRTGTVCSEGWKMAGMPA